VPIFLDLTSNTPVNLCPEDHILELARDLAQNGNMERFTKISEEAREAFIQEVGPAVSVCGVSGASAHEAVCACGWQVIAELLFLFAGFKLGEYLGHFETEDEPPETVVARFEIAWDGSGRFDPREAIKSAIKNDGLLSYLRVDELDQAQSSLPQEYARAKQRLRETKPERTPLSKFRPLSYWAPYWGYSAPSLRKLCNEGQIPYQKLLGKYQFPLDVLPEAARKIEQNLIREKS
jgi:hypothetical protein